MLNDIVHLIDGHIIVTIIIINVVTSQLTWWIIPLPGFQKPTPYLAPAEAKNS